MTLDSCHKEALPAPAFSVDALVPDAIARKAEEIGAKKAVLDTLSLLALAVLAGAFIGLGAMFSTTVTAGASGILPFGVVRLLGGMVFAMGLVLVVVGGAEQVTGNNLMVMAWASRRISTGALLRAWGLVYVGNFVGAVATAVLVFLSYQYASGGADVGKTALALAHAKTSFPFIQAVFLGILCNVLVCLAVWLALGARSTTDKILAVLPPIAAFITAGFEHSVANMYSIPLGLMIKTASPDAFWLQAGVSAADYPALTMAGLAANLVPVTVGNVIGGSVLVGAVYLFIYLRRR